MLTRVWRKGNPFALLVGMQTGTATVESSMEIPQKIKNRSTFSPAIPLLGIYPRQPKTLIQKNISTPMFTAALATITKIRKQTKCPSVDEWIRQLQDVYTMEILLSRKKEENFTLCNSMGGPGEHYGWRSAK